jgi:hypothetical protein
LFDLALEAIQPMLDFGQIECRQSVSDEQATGAQQQQFAF